MAEVDKEAEAFRLKWKARLGLTDREALGSYMKAASADAAGYGTLSSEQGKTMLSVRVDGRGLDGAADPGAIPDMIVEWQGMLNAERPADPRAFTKRAIIEAIGRNVHLDAETGPYVLSAVAWLASRDDQVRDALERGDVTLLCDVTFDDQSRTSRFRMELGFEADEGSAT